MLLMDTPDRFVEKTRVLVVDDERHIARFLEFVLKKAGYDVALAYSGEQALVAVEAFDPDVMLLDLVLPKLTGLDEGFPRRQWRNGDIERRLSPEGGDADRRNRTTVEFDTHG
jgi:hypothetical protein